MRRKKTKASKSVNLQTLPILHPDAAGIDVGAKQHLVAVPADRDPRPVRTFQAFTPELHELAQWLKHCRIRTVALESTGIYWIALYEVLEQHGFEVQVVNARHVKHVPGRSKPMCWTASGSKNSTVLAYSTARFGLISRFASSAPTSGSRIIWWSTTSASAP
jgi:hypothetical protein